jgi:hypothetical protein
MLLTSDAGTPIPSNFTAHLRVNLTIVSLSDDLLALCLIAFHPLQTQRQFAPVEPPSTGGDAGAFVELLGIVSADSVVLPASRAHGRSLADVYPHSWSHGQVLVITA